MSKPPPWPSRRFFRTVVKFWMIGVLELEESFDSCITATLTLCRFKNSPNSVSLLPMPFAFNCMVVNVKYLWLTNQITDDLTIIPNESFQSCVDNCNSVIDSVATNDDDANIELSNQVNSKYLDIDHLIKLKANPLSLFNIIHTNNTRQC